MGQVACRVLISKGVAPMILAVPRSTLLDMTRESSGSLCDRRIPVVVNLL